LRRQASNLNTFNEEDDENNSDIIFTPRRQKISTNRKQDERGAQSARPNKEITERKKMPHEFYI
jgi:hypothetical protein